MSERQNVVMVTFDSLRADHCGFMGYDGNTTPTLDRMAQEGVVFENAVAPGPATPESMPASFTGMIPVDDGDDGNGRLPTQQQTIQKHMRARESLPEWFARQGYATAGFTPNPYTSRFFGFDQGFDHFQDFMNTTLRKRVFRFVKESVGPIARAAFDWTFKQRSFRQWESFYDEIYDWIEDAPEPYFVWIMLMDTHVPYFVPREYRSENSWWEMIRATWRLQRTDFGTPLPPHVHEDVLSAYDDSIRYADAFLQRLRTDLNGNDPVYVFHADHGEGFHEHESYYHTGYLYSENVHVPLVVSGTGESASVSSPVSLLALPELVKTIGRDGDLHETVAENCRPGTAFARASTGRRVAVLRDNWKLIAGPDELELYDLDSDPGERENRAAARPDQTARLLHELGERLRTDDELRAVSSGSRRLPGGEKI